MDLRARLRMMGAAGKMAVSVPAPPVPTVPTAATAPSLLQTLPGLQMMSTDVGPVMMLETDYPLAYHRGRVSLDQLLTVPATGWGRLGRHPLWQHHPCRRWVFVDTETTGLGGGTGTFIFLAGIGRITNTGFRLRQYFLADLPQEPAFLAALMTEFADADVVVTFNGKSFDWPLLQSRCILQGQRLPALPHLDILHPARRLWREVTDDRSLRGLETAILNESRLGDVPGHLIPGLYFQYLHSGDAVPLREVFLHNRLDILSLTAVTAYLGHAMSDPLQAAPAERPLSALELLAAGRWLAGAGEPMAGAAALTAALISGLPSGLQATCRRALARTHRRNNAPDQALKVWQDWVDTGVATHPEPFVELAKHYEHRVRDLHRAREMTLQALAAVERLTQLGRAAATAHGATAAGPPLSLPALQHRLQRLQARLRRQQSTAT